jgi:hypothetical protein
VDHRKEVDGGIKNCLEWSEPDLLCFERSIKKCDHWRNIFQTMGVVILTRFDDTLNRRSHCFVPIKNNI